MVGGKIVKPKVTEDKPLKPAGKPSAPDETKPKKTPEKPTRTMPTDEKPDDKPHKKPEKPDDKKPSSPTETYKTFTSETTVESDETVHMVGGKIVKTTVVQPSKPEMCIRDRPGNLL